MSKEDIDAIFLGATCQQITRSGPDRGEGSWRFEFDNGSGLDLSCAWRIVIHDCIALGYRDHGHKFGLPAPVDAVADARKLLTGPVRRVIVREATADVDLEFESGACLEVFNSSSGYEGWECWAKNGMLVVAVGGGKLVVFPGYK